ncbi:unnamed protein product [Hymenolepis diminuta]|uniref:RT_RNaseH_2 domain-containing protein n=1 Tax=Hymenolepis diminuta TaxID=6216 RepID=A0A0R3SKY9_HYMDI|nr:unnamed protein product [Hymenolepis diminuta]
MAVVSFLLKNVREADIHDMLLNHYNLEFSTGITPDASSYCVGGVILHAFPDGSEKVVAHLSRSLTPAAKNYEQIGKEVS